MTSEPEIKYPHQGSHGFLKFRHYADVRTRLCFTDSKSLNHKKNKGDNKEPSE